MNIAKKAIIALVVTTLTLFNVSPWLTEPTEVDEVQEAQLISLEATMSQAEPEVEEEPVL